MTEEAIEQTTEDAIVIQDPPPEEEFEQEAEKVEETQLAEGPEISDELRAKIIEKAIADGKVVDYESRFKPIYGALKNTERELEASRRQAPSEVKEINPGGPKPKLDDYENYEDFTEAMTDWKMKGYHAEQQKQEAKRRQEEARRNWDDQISAASAKDPQFLEKGYIPEGLVPALEGSDRLVDFAYYFGENPKEAQRLMTMNPVAAAREIGRMEAEFKAPPKKTSTTAIRTTKPITGTGVSTKSPDDMTMEEYSEWRRSGGGK